MTIIERKTELGHEYRFDNGAWVRLLPEEAPDEGSWEFMGDEDDEETYMSGGYLLEGKTLYEYDGCFELPKEVVLAMADYGYEIDL